MRKPRWFFGTKLKNLNKVSSYFFLNIIRKFKISLFNTYVVLIFTNKFEFSVQIFSVSIFENLNFGAFWAVVYQRSKYLAKAEVVHYLAFGYSRRSFILNVRPSVYFKCLVLTLKRREDLRNANSSWIKTLGKSR